MKDEKTGRTFWDFLAEQDGETIIFLGFALMVLIMVVVGFVVS